MGLARWFWWVSLRLGRAVRPRALQSPHHTAARHTISGSEATPNIHKYTARSCDFSLYGRAQVWRRMPSQGGRGLRRQPDAALTSPNMPLLARVRGSTAKPALELPAPCAEPAPSPPVRHSWAARAPLQSTECGLAGASHHLRLPCAAARRRPVATLRFQQPSKSSTR